MKHSSVRAAALALVVCAIQMTTPAPAAAQGGAPTNAAPRASDGVPREIPANHVTGIDIDRFIGDPYKAFTRVTNGGLNARTMLRHGDPYKPGANGAVLEYRDEATGFLEKVDGKMRMTRVVLKPRITISAEANRDRAVGLVGRRAVGLSAVVGRALGERRRIPGRGGLRRRRHPGWRRPADPRRRGRQVQRGDGPHRPA